MESSVTTGHNSSGVSAGKPQKILYPCNFCEFEATSARQLSRHKAVTHVKNPLSCVLCPFVTAYQTNLLRHRREVHGILGSKGNKSCKFCGFEADDNDTLILHQKQVHEDILNSARERFAREKKTARGNVQSTSNSSSVNGDSPEHATNEQIMNPTNANNKRSSTTAQLTNASKALKKYAAGFAAHAAPIVTAPRFAFPEYNNINSDEEDENDFWKEGFIDNPPSLVNFNYSDFHADRVAAMALAAQAKQQQQIQQLQQQLQQQQQQQQREELEPVEMNPLDGERQAQINFYGDFSPNSAGGSEYGSSRPSTPLFGAPATEGISTLNSSQNSDSLASAVKADGSLAPTRIRRQYNCNDCGFHTVNPREFLYHRRDAHGQKVKIVECPYCVYACQYFQKLQRHMLLVHKLETSITPPGDQSPAESAEVINGQRDLPTDSASRATISAGGSLLRRAVQGNISQPQLFPANGKSEIDKELDMDDDDLGEQMSPDEMDPDLLVDPSKKLFRCEQCEYISNEQYLFNKHKKYHQTKPRQCDKCDFNTRFPPSFEAHSASHGSNAAFTCDRCDFASEFEREINVHLSSHHQVLFKEEEDDEEMNGVHSTVKHQPLNGRTAQSSTHFDDEMLEESTNAIADDEDDGQEDEQLDEDDLIRSHANIKIKQESNNRSLSNRLISNSTKIKPLAFTNGGSVNGKNGVSLSIARGSSALSGISYIRKMPSKSNIGSIVSMKSCKHCPFKTDTYSKLERHEASFHRDSSFQCPFCETPFDALPLLQRHLTTFHREDKQAANFVNMLEMLFPRNMTKSNETARSNSGAAGSESVFSRCKLCGYTTRWPSELQKHMRVHTDVRPFACPHCQYRCKWKGDMNRHVLKFHRGAPTKIEPVTQMDAASTNEEENGGGASSVEGNEKETEALVRSGSDTKIKVYKCSFCEFTCTTASRFHVHYVQHLNTKPFMCSVCQHRSNWEWDVTKHIKMKSQRDSDHLNAHPVLIDDSGKRNYSKYDKFLQLVPACEFPACETGDSKRLRLDGANTEAEEQAAAAEEDPESIVITPDINFSFGNDANVTTIFPQQQQPANSVPYINAASTPQGPQAAPHARPAKLFYCAYCDYTHRDSKSLVSHLSIHAGRKPFKCKLCGFSSNWREVLNRHVASRHNGAGADIEQLFKYTVSKYICRIIDETGLINPGPEITTQADVRQPGQESAVDSPAESNQHRRSPTKENYLEESLLKAVNKQLPNDPNASASVTANNWSLINTLLSQQFFSPVASNSSKHGISMSSSLAEASGSARKEQTQDTPQVLAKHGISGRVSGFKGTFKCVICPFRAEKSFHMDFHLKRHTQLPGADYKCPQCPYWVNAKKSLVKHIYLHKYENELEDESGDPEAGGVDENGDISAASSVTGTELIVSTQKAKTYSRAESVAKPNVITKRTIKQFL